MCQEQSSSEKHLSPADEFAQIEYSQDTLERPRSKEEGYLSRPSRRSICNYILKIIANNLHASIGEQWMLKCSPHGLGPSMRGRVDSLEPPGVVWTVVSRCCARALTLFRKIITPNRRTVVFKSQMAVSELSVNGYNFD